jgi:hypothetical protein
MTKYVRKLGKKVDAMAIKDEEKTKDTLSKMHEANLTLLTIKLGKIHGEILKQIAPYFNLSVDSTTCNNDSDQSSNDSESDN